MEGAVCIAVGEAERREVEETVEATKKRAEDKPKNKAEEEDERTAKKKAGDESKSAAASCERLCETATPSTTAMVFRENVPEPIRFIASGGTGSAIFWALNEACVAALPEDTPASITVAWFLSYVVSIWIQHFLHATLVYGWKTSYWSGLAATYVGYSGALFASIPINAGLVQGMGFTASQAWLGTLLVTGIGNYFLLSILLGGKKKDEDKQ